MRKKKNFHTTAGFVVMVVLLCFMSSGVLQAQLQLGHEDLTRGKLWQTLWNTLQHGNPVDPPSQLFTMDYPGYTSGANWDDHMAYIESGGYQIYGERGGTNVAYTIGTRFYGSSQYVFATENAALTTNYNMENPALLAEEIVTGAHHVIELDVDVAHKSMVWSYPNYDDFVIHEFTITNTGANDITNVHFGTRYGMWITQKGDWIGPGVDNDEKYGWDATRNMFYIYDDWSFDFESEEPVTWTYGPASSGDVGDAMNLNPETRITELLSPGYFASICLDPAGGNVYQNIVEYLGQGSSTNAPIEDFMFRQGADPAARFLTVMTHQQPPYSWDEAKAGAAGGEGGNKYERQAEMLVSCGPYDLGPGASVTVVFAEVIGEMDRAKIVAGGAANIDLLATESLAALQTNVDNCRAMYAANYNVPHPPPTPTDGESSLTLTAIGGGAKIAWPPISPDYRDPSTGLDDFAGYKVYRSSYFVSGPWTEIANIAKGSEMVEEGMVVYSDENLPLGVGNYYSVTSYDDDGNESGKVNPNRFPVYPLRAPNEQFPDKVYVVPNPFRQDSHLLGSGENLRMEFIGLPSKCTIRIYTLSGDLVREIPHDDGSGSQAWGSIETLDYQTNSWQQYVSPGFYLFHVESLVSGQEGKSFIGKFAVVR
jgi:hypothetical protein